MEVREFLQTLLTPTSSQVSIKIRKSPNHKGLSSICTFVFSAFGYKISAVKYRIFVRFCQFLLAIFRFLLRQSSFTKSLSMRTNTLLRINILRHCIDFIYLIQTYFLPKQMSHQYYGFRLLLLH